MHTQTYTLSHTHTHTHTHTHPDSHRQPASQPFAPHSHPQILPSSALPAQRQTGAAQQPVKGVEGRSSGVREREREREREGDIEGGGWKSEVENEAERALFPICWGGMGGWTSCPHWSLLTHGSVRPRSPREPGNAAEPRVREKEGSQRRGEEREKSPGRGEERRGKKATTVGCPTRLLCRDDVRGHVTQALQWRHMEGRKETSFKAGAFWVVWGLCSPPKQPQNHRRAARGWCLRATWSVNG